MNIDEVKYNKLFLDQFKADAEQLNNEYKRVIEQFGNSNETKLSFYSEVFETLIKQFKNKLDKNSDFEHIISNLYQHFINALEEDKIDASKYKKKLITFKSTQRQLITVSESGNLPIYKNYNLNTKYGRRKAREQAALNYQNGTPEYKNDIDNLRIIVYIILFLVAIIIIMIKIS